MAKNNVVHELGLLCDMYIREETTFEGVGIQKCLFPKIAHPNAFSAT